MVQNMRWGLLFTSDESVVSYTETCNLNLSVFEVTLHRFGDSSSLCDQNGVNAKTVDDD